jgi:hypothetical protein
MAGDTLRGGVKEPLLGVVLLLADISALITGWNAYNGDVGVGYACLYLF